MGRTFFFLASKKKFKWFLNCNFLKSIFRAEFQLDDQLLKPSKWVFLVRKWGSNSEVHKPQGGHAPLGRGGWGFVSGRGPDLRCSSRARAASAARQPVGRPRDRRACHRTFPAPVLAPAVLSHLPCRSQDKLCDAAVTTTSHLNPRALKVPHQNLHESQYFTGRHQLVCAGSLPGRR